MLSQVFWCQTQEITLSPIVYLTISCALCSHPLLNQFSKKRKKKETEVRSRLGQNWLYGRTALMCFVRLLIRFSFSFFFFSSVAILLLTVAWWSVVLCYNQLILKRSHLIHSQLGRIRHDHSVSSEEEKGWGILSGCSCDKYRKSLLTMAAAVGAGQRSSLQEEQKNNTKGFSLPLTGFGRRSVQHLSGLFWIYWTEKVCPSILHVFSMGSFSDGHVK